MSLDLRQVRANVIRPALQACGLWSEAAELLVFGTGVQESGFRYLVQIGGGPGRGFWQMEPATDDDIHETYLAYRAGLRGLVEATMVPKTPRAEQLVWNLGYATVMCRIHYLRDPAPLPAADDLDAMGALWKRRYNTPSGAGTAEQFVLNLRRALA